MLAPRWWWPVRKSSFFEGGDRRAAMRQALIGVFQPRASELTGWRRARAIASGNLQSFSGDEGQFADVIGKREVVRTAFRESIRPRWRALADQHHDAVIGIHVRRGDFKHPERPEDFVHKGALRTPLEWFVEMLRLVRNVADREFAAVVVSDGSAADLHTLLAEPNVRLLEPACPASDLLVLSQTRFILGSGGSSFSSWGSYLGDVPIVTVPGQDLSWFGLHNAVPYVGTAEPHAPDDNFLAIVRAL